MYNNRLSAYKAFFGNWPVVATKKEIIDELEALCVANGWAYQRDGEYLITLIESAG